MPVTPGVGRFGFRLGWTAEAAKVADEGTFTVTAAWRPAWPRSAPGRCGPRGDGRPAWRRPVWRPRGQPSGAPRSFGPMGAEVRHQIEQQREERLAFAAACWSAVRAGGGEADVASIEASARHAEWEAAKLGTLLARSGRAAA